MNKVGRELPASSKCLRQLSFSKHMKAGDMATLTVYPGKLEKKVCVLSSLHMSIELDESEKKKPQTVEFYNQTKCGVDVANQMARQNSVKTGINAFVLYKKTHR